MRGMDRSGQNESNRGRPENKIAEGELITDVLAFCRARKIDAPVTEQCFAKFLNMVMVHYDVIFALHSNFIFYSRKDPNEEFRPRYYRLCVCIK